MTFLEYHAKNREQLLQHINNFFQEKESHETIPLAALAMKRLHEFSIKGKLLRGGFVMFATEMYGSPITKEVLNIACSLELSHTGVLTHDDIMDNDRLRRGQPTIFAQYEEDAKNSDVVISPEEYGKSMAIGIGDIGILLTHDLIGAGSLADSLRSKIMQEYSLQMNSIWHGQFLDYHYGASSYEPTVAEIEKMYELKTGSYTFTLPFVLGAYLAGVADDEINLLRTITAKLGTVFQIKDDEMGLFGDSDVTGKPRGSDLTEGKKTLFRAALMHAMNEDEKASFPSMDVEEVCKLIETYGIRKDLQNKAEALSAEAQEGIAKLHIDSQFRDLLIQLVAYNLTREK